MPCCVALCRYIDCCYARRRDFMVLRWAHCSLNKDLGPEGRAYYFLFFWLYQRCTQWISRRLELGLVFVVDKGLNAVCLYRLGISALSPVSFQLDPLDLAGGGCLP